MIVRGYRKDESGNDVLTDIFDIIECTYKGVDMGERSIVATVNWPSPIDFKVGDYVELQMQSLVRGAGMEGGVDNFEKFYIYTMPTIKKTARPMTHGQAFEHTITFYPAQYELGLVQMRDMGDMTGADSIIYTGFDNVTFYGGAHELMERVMRVLAEAYKDSDGKPLWNYRIANEVNETLNTALERFPLTFSGNTVMDAIVKLNDKEGINTTFFINGRTIYVGFKRPFFCRVTENNAIDTDVDSQMFNFSYGKTSHEKIDIDHGGLYDITKSISKDTPITKLFAYGAARNLNRYYCSDRIAGGRYVNRLMLPSFSNDGKTDFIISEDAAATYGIREGSKHFEEIYPSLRYMTYGDIRRIKYCIKIKASGLEHEAIGESSYPIARVQCYKVIESATKGVNTLVEAAPAEDLAIYVHAVGKVVKVVLFGGANDAEAIDKQLSRDAKVPTRTYGGTDYIPGSCFLVHDDNFDTNTSHLVSRDSWFVDVKNSTQSGLSDEAIREISVHQINYDDTFWLTDLYIFTGYNQSYFDRTGYSAWAYPKLNSNYKSASGDIAHDTVYVNEIVAVEPVVVEDTSANIVGVDVDGRQKTFDIYLRDVGFKIDEQNDFGEKVFVVADTVKISMLDGMLAGKEFEVSDVTSDSQFSCICAYNEDGTINDDFFIDGQFTGREVPQEAFDKGAIWRLRCNRTDTDPDYSNMNIALPNTKINASAGDHVVLLDIFMPDIYVQAAEQRLLKAARKYLNANDRGKMSYAVNFDKVRMQQISNYALQMREGLNLRMIDEDLGISTLNRVTKLFEGSLLTNTSMYETIYDSEPTTKYWYEVKHRDYFDIRKHFTYVYVNGEEYIDQGLSTINITLKKGNGTFGGFSISGSIYALCIDNDANASTVFAKDGKMKMRIAKRHMLHTDNIYGAFYTITDSYIVLNVSNVRKVGDGTILADFSISDASQIVLETYKEGNQEVMYGVVEYDIKIRHEYDGTTYIPNTDLKPYGSIVYAPSKALISFTSGKHYKIVFEISEPRLLKLNKDSSPHFVLMNNLSDNAFIFEPNCTSNRSGGNDQWDRYEFEFDLDNGFNDSQDYYPALIFVSDNKTEYVATKLISVIESDSEGYKDLNYADFTVQDVTIKITDSTHRTFSQPIKEITATLSEQNNAGAWATLMSNVEKTQHESDENARISQEIINVARKNYRSLLNLRDSIFDPDGTCDQTFLQVMMLQVGADSMNYYLDKTRVSANLDTLYNCSCKKDDIDGKYHFVVYDEDKLHHIVYTDNGGEWSIPNGIDTILDMENGVYPTYFVSIKCQQFGNEGEWVCSTKQCAVNEEVGYYHFNWGILMSDSQGNYTLVETRGNAYMYGDNLVCGKISTLAGNSYFDLTHGNFVLNDDNANALSFIDGVLKISDALETSTEIEGGLLATNLIALKDEYGSVTAGMSGKQDDSSDSYGVSMFAGGTYDEALLQAQAMAKDAMSTLEKVLPILLTKKGIGSKIGCFEVVSDSQVAIYNNDRSNRILLSAATSYSDNISMKLQELEDENYVDRVIISDESINVNILHRAFPSQPNISTIKEKGDPCDTSYLTVAEWVSLPDDGWVFNVNSKMYAQLHFDIHTGLEIRNMYFAPNTYLELWCDNSVVLSKDLSGLQAERAGDNIVLFKIPLFDSTPFSFGKGTYRIRICLNDVKTGYQFLRINSVGASYTETLNNSRFVNGSIGFSLYQDVYFTKNTDIDTRLVKIGKDGMKITYNSSSNFVVKNDSDVMNVMINGLPKNREDVKSPGGLYVEGNALMIK